MVMRKNAVVELAEEVLLPQAQTEWERLKTIDGWLRWTPEQIKVPQHASQEQKGLRDLAESGWMRLVVTNLAQQLFAEQCSSAQRKQPEGEIIAPVMMPWLRNRMESRQRAIHRAALGYGYAYSTVLPGDTGSVIRGRSPRDMYAVYQDPVVDEYPMYYVLKSGANGFLVVDEDTVFTLQRDASGKLFYITEDHHDTGVTPAIRYSNQIDLEGRTPGEVEPLVKEAMRVHKTTYDRLLQQHFNSWKVKTATGLEMPEDPEERKRVRALLEHDSILMGEEGVAFSTLDETPLDGIIKAEDRDVETFAAIAQTPAHALTGKMVNLSADAISEARAMLDLKAGERKLGFGDSHVQTLRLAAFQEGRQDDAEDFTLRMEWRDLGSRSMNQAADALGKMATMLKIPVEMLWSRLPGVSAEEAAKWQRWALEHPSAEEQLAASLRVQSNGTDG